ncbi:hypothetical protein M153_10380002938 [Pseudoloma neurophilia]|uniref:Uncharacterized protein n=1 Tax=Pseudoloma neurophilia TaxID=146866 RepID=A0A0R0LVE0_9MICR|nr:hypothetical protein M153_10380002938 [Pseudoloma neurophilia]
MIGKKEVKLNNLSYMALFDTGSAFNLITQQAVLQIPFIKIEPLDKPVFITLLDGRSLVAKFKCILIVTF